MADDQHQSRQQERDVAVEPILIQVRLRGFYSKPNFKFFWEFYGSYPDTHSQLIQISAVINYHHVIQVIALSNTVGTWTTQTHFSPSKGGYDSSENNQVTF